MATSLRSHLLAHPSEAIMRAAGHASSSAAAANRAEREARRRHAELLKRVGA